jgi:hypothetical protein
VSDWLGVNVPDDVKVWIQYVPSFVIVPPVANAAKAGRIGKKLVVEKTIKNRIAVEIIRLELGFISEEGIEQSGIILILEFSVTVTYDLYRAKGVGSRKICR